LYTIIIIIIIIRFDDIYLNSQEAKFIMILLHILLQLFKMISTIHFIIDSVDVF